MELRHLRALEAVLATGSFTAAAAARHVSQPALWAQIKELEAELGLKLFLRSGRGVAPTAACLALRPRLDVALRELGDFRRAATEIRDGWDAPARIACAPSHVSRFLAGCLRALVDREPRSPFPVIVPVTTQTAIETLESGGVDLLVEPRSKRARRDAAPLYPVRVVAVGHAARAKSAALHVRALDGVPLATMPSDSLVRRMLGDAAAAADVRLRVVHESRDAAALLALAREGLCTAVLADEMLDEGAAERAVPLAGRRALAVELWLAWRNEEALSPAARALRDVMIERAAARRAATGARRPSRRRRA
ncbi:MAG: LysR family transcriptional regulator [Sandaracinaceae bacterium]|nr:LysR family transcriptional regulator [Sandaracinaceae bacterium]